MVFGPRLAEIEQAVHIIRGSINQQYVRPGEE